jgi:hypothetical protein
VYESRPLSACSDPGSTKKYEAIIDSLYKKQEELKRHMDQERICADALKRLRAMTPNEVRHELGMNGLLINTRCIKGEKT